MNKFFRKIKDFFIKNFDLEDLFVFCIALPMIFYGLFILYKPVSFVTVGFLILYLSSGSRKVSK